MPEVTTVLQGFSAATSEGSIAYCAVTLIRGQKLTLVDVGHHGRIVMLTERLKAMGIAPGDIERVILTHAHWDHCFNLAAFPNAEVVIDRAEWDYIHEPNPLDWATPPWAPSIFERAKLVRPVRDGEQIEPGVRVMAVPGHSPGSMATLVESPGGMIGIVGDALTSRAAAGYAAPSLIFYDEKLARESARKILDTCGVIYPGHDRPFAVEAGNFRYIEQTSLTFINVPRDEDGTIRASVSDAPLPTGPGFAPSARRMQ